jgi:hypothetical protein
MTTPTNRCVQSGAARQKIAAMEYHMDKPLARQQREAMEGFAKIVAAGRIDLPR